MKTCTICRGKRRSLINDCKCEQYFNESNYDEITLDCLGCLDGYALVNEKCELIPKIN